MSGYSVNERKLGRDRKPVTATCGDCGEPIEHGKLLCDDCVAEIALGPFGLGTSNSNGD